MDFEQVLAEHTELAQAEALCSCRRPTDEVQQAEAKVEHRWQTLVAYVSGLEDALRQAVGALPALTHAANQYNCQDRGDGCPACDGNDLRTTAVAAAQTALALPAPTGETEADGAPGDESSVLEYRGESRPTDRETGAPRSESFVLSKQ